jgi:hypothetical protein
MIQYRENYALKVSMPATFFNQVTGGHLASLHFLAKGTHSLNNFPVRDIFLFFFDRDKHSRGHAVPGNRNFFAARNSIQ